jgi:hypothetical protein
MAVEVKTSGDHPASMNERALKRLRSSGDPRADYIVQKGDGPTRTFTHGFHSGHVVQPGTEAKPTSGFVDKQDESWRQK